MTNCSEIIKWWSNINPISNEEKEILNNKRSKEIIYPKSDNVWKELSREYFDRIPFCNITNETHTIMFDECATNHIKNLFKEYVDNDTLVVFSNNEHHNVQAEVEKCKNKLKLDFYKDIRTLNISKVISESKKYKKVFVYVIGTQISTGEITPQSFYEELKKRLVSENINHIMVLDDVQGMFIVPRDYRIFDYIVGTAHALIEGYDMGILISRKDKFGIKALNWGQDYLKSLDIILNRKEQMYMFSNIMERAFEYILFEYGFGLFNNTTPHIFSIKTNGMKFTEEMHEILDKYCIRLEGIGNSIVPNVYIRFRAQLLLRYTDECIKGLDVLNEILSNIKYN